jgi:hypothetical protein
LVELEKAGFPRGSQIVTSREVQAWKEGTDAWKAARSGIHFSGMGTDEDKEWVEVYEVDAELHGWKFSREWYYWTAKASGGEPVPLEEAARLDEKLGGVLRVDGYAGGKRPQGPVSVYHIDRPDALAALVESIKRRREEAMAAWRERHNL